MNTELAHKRHHCEYCEGRGFVIDRDNDQYCCPRCKGDCDDPVFEEGIQAGIAAERERCAKICDKESLWQKQEAGIVAARKCASLIRGQNG